MTVQVVLGSTSLPVASLMKLARGAIVSLDQRVGDPVDVVVNGTVVARGEIANLRVGKVLPLQCNDFTAIRLECSGRRHEARPRRDRFA